MSTPSTFCEDGQHGSGRQINGISHDKRRVHAI
jgi:hypothetical protein